MKKARANPLLSLRRAGGARGGRDRVRGGQHFGAGARVRRGFTLPAVALKENKRYVDDQITVNFDLIKYFYRTRQCCLVDNTVM